MKTACLCLLLCWHILSPVAAHAQKSIFSINPIALPNYIADNNIQMALQDQAGLLWFVTDNGLYRYDGTDLLHFGVSTAPALPSLAITALSTDNRGNLWIGFNNGAARFDLKNWKIVPVFSPEAHSLNPHDKKIRSIACLNDEMVYYGTQSGKLFRVHQDSLIQLADLGTGRISFSPMGPPLKEPAITNIQEPIAGQLWLTTEDGLLVSIDKTAQGFEKPLIYRHPAIVNLPIKNICYDSSGKCLFSVADQGLYLSDIRQLYRAKKQSNPGKGDQAILKMIRQAPIPDSVQEAHYENFFYVPGGQIGIITMGTGINRYIYTYNFETNQWWRNPQSFQAKNPGEIIRKVSSSPSSRVSYIISSGGLAAIRAESLPFNMLLASEKNINSIRAIYARSDTLYVGSYQNYFVRFNRRTGQVTPLIIGYVYSILPWSEDSLLIGSEGGGLHWYTISDNKLSPVAETLELAYPAAVYQSKYITALQRVDNRLLLEGTTRGLHLVDPVAKKLYPVFSNSSAKDMQGVKINAISPYSSGKGAPATKYLVGTDAGAFIADIKTGRTRYLFADSIAQEIRQTKVHSLLTHSGKIWIGTGGLGLLAVNQAGQLDFMEWLQDKLTGQVIYSLIQSGDHILIGTNNGLNILNLTDSSLATYQASDGMYADEFNQNAFYQSGSDSYLGTMNGIIWSNADKADDRNYPSTPFATISKVVVVNKNNVVKNNYHLAYLPADAVQLQIPADTRYFSIIFDNPENSNSGLPYYYRLSEDQQWVSLGTRRQITFNKMPPGDYTLQLSSHLKNNKDSEAILRLPITVLPSFYETVWFKGLVLMFVAGAVFVVMRYRQKQKDKERNLRTKIAGDLHDEIGSSLTRIWHQAQHLQLDSAQKRANNAKAAGDKRLEHIATTSQEAMSMLSDMVWSIDAQFDTIEELLVRMRTYMYQLKNEFEIPVEMSVGNTGKGRRVSQIVRQNLFLVFKEGINNAIKYGDGSVITISLNIDDTFKMEISNACSNHHTNVKTIGGRGLINMQRRVKKMNGTMKITKRDNRFTLLVVV